MSKAIANWQAAQQRAMAGRPRSYESVELLRDTVARWQTLRLIRDSAAMAANKEPSVANALRVPTTEI